ncbi:alpha-amylase family protein [Aureibaculum luteum]|uniref:alpha-amylase family protein n=1 Tax=Aureibaculum luteum TaxID=1548456 RepID=UPI000E54DED5|nr:alpha-amylase family protein [Aureibaculum luteum]
MRLFKFIIVVFLSFTSCKAQNVPTGINDKIETLQNLIKKAEKKGIDVLKEKTTIRTAEIFLKFANWDEKNVETNVTFFKKVPSYKADAEKLAQDLPAFERKEIYLMLDKAESNLRKLISKEIYRKPSPNVDWTKVNVEGDQITYNNRPVFLADYTWKPDGKLYNEYHGNQDGFFLTPPQVIDSNGTVNPRVINELDSKADGSIGFIFMNHKNVPDWTTKKYEEGFKMREDTYTAYDIDNPGARELQKYLLGAVVPKMAGKKFTQLGYMLCNEPHFYAYSDKTKKKKPWASGPVSEYTIAKFKDWLQHKHHGISELNRIWRTNFTSFETITANIPLDISLKGTPIWYDWVAFNMDRVTEWYTFLKDEVKTHDPEAKVHLKIMPNLWTNNMRAHGIDFEALTDLSDIIGNDSGADHKYTWGKPHEWQKKYAFEWRELCMGYDFLKSVSSDKINFNSELHYLSTVRSRDLYLDPSYARATFWLAHSYGMTASQIWFWPRKADGEVTDRAGKGYAGSNNQQPRVTNEVAMTLIDLNTNAEAIMTMQRQRKPIRLFYSKTSAINNGNHMDNQFKMYEALHFEGTPLGFVTQNIIKKQDNSNWNIVVVYNTPNVTKEELQSLQNYLDNGGTVILDNKSLLKDEYGQALLELKASKGILLMLNSVLEIKNKVLSILKDKNSLPEVKVEETNAIGTKGCIWKVIKNEAGNNVLSVVNVGKSDATLNITLNGSDAIICKDLIDGIEVSKTPVLKPFDVYFVEITKN